jgi:hypothetical protein
MERCEEVVVAGRRKVEFAEEPAMRGNDAIKPHRRIGQILRQSFLNFKCTELSFFPDSSPLESGP